MGVTNAQQISRAEVFEYMSLTGAELDPGQPLTDEQRAQLASLRQQQQDEAMARQQAWEQSPEGQQALAEQQLRVDQLEGQEDRVAQSRARAEQIMETPVDER